MIVACLHIACADLPHRKRAQASWLILVLLIKFDGLLILYSFVFGTLRYGCDLNWLSILRSSKIPLHSCLIIRSPLLTLWSPGIAPHALSSPNLPPHPLLPPLLLDDFVALLNRSVLYFFFISVFGRFLIFTHFLEFFSGKLSAIPIRPSGRSASRVARPEDRQLRQYHRLLVSEFPSSQTMRRY